MPNARFLRLWKCIVREISLFFKALMRDDEGVYAWRRSQLMQTDNFPSLREHKTHCVTQENIPLVSSIRLTVSSLKCSLEFDDFHFSII